MFEFLTVLTMLFILQLFMIVSILMWTYAWSQFPDGLKQWFANLTKGFDPPPSDRCHAFVDKISNMSGQDADRLLEHVYFAIDHMPALYMYEYIDNKIKNGEAIDI